MDRDSLWRACSSSLEHAKEAFDQLGWGRSDVVEGLGHAVLGGNLEVVQWIFLTAEEVAGFHLTDLINCQSKVFGMSPVCIAASEGFLDLVQWLVANGAILSGKSRGGRTIIHEAAGGGHLPVIEWLWKEEIPLDDRDDEGDTPLHDAAEFGSVSVVDWFVKRGVDINEKNNNGRTPLHCASERGHKKIVEVLVQCGADVNCCDENDWTPLTCAKAAGHEDIVELLVAKRARSYVKVDFGKQKMLAVDMPDFSSEINQDGNDPFLSLQSSSTIISDDALEHQKEEGSMENDADNDVFNKGSDNFDAHFHVDGVSRWLANTALDDTKHEVEDYMEYLINPEDIEVDFPMKDNMVALWLGIPVEIKLMNSVQSENIVDKLDQLSRLHHPHLVNLYGVTKIKVSDTLEEPIFIYERATGGSLLDYISNKANEMTRNDDLWDKLYDASLGLQYLHDRNIVHGCICCDSIVVAADGAAKLRNVNWMQMADDDYLFWTSPERVLGSPHSFEADIFALGMTIIQAFNYPESLWNIQHLTPRDAIVSGKLPSKPDAMTTSQWCVVKQMCCYKPQNRLSASEVVIEMKLLQQQTISAEVQLETIPHVWANLGDFVVESAYPHDETISSYLHQIDTLCGNLTPMDLMNRDVYDRIAAAFEQLKLRTDVPTEEIIQRYTFMLRFYYKTLRALHARITGPINFGLNHQAVKDTSLMHKCVDAFLQYAGLSHSIAIHKWQRQWKIRRKQHQQEIAEALSNIPAFLSTIPEEKREDVLVYLQFELFMHPAHYMPKHGAVETNSLRAKSIISYLRFSIVEPWFIPEYEIEFDNDDAFTSGLKRRGSWRRAPVLVKSLILRSATESEDGTSDAAQEIFISHVKLWFKLRHPHIVPLFGACHLNQPLLVCEYAGGGQLDTFLRTYPNDVWQKLYEAALGLQYLHTMNMVHGDLNCSNILVGSDGLTKLSDFGLSNLTSAMSTMSASENTCKLKVGAIPWRAPEVKRGEEVTFASDIYSFGICILEAVCEEYPWGKAIPDSIAEFHRMLPNHPVECSDDIYELVKKMCCYNPDDRVSITDVVEALGNMRVFAQNPLPVLVEDKVESSLLNDSGNTTSNSNRDGFSCGLSGEVVLGSSITKEIADSNIFQADLDAMEKMPWYIDKKEIIFDNDTDLGEGYFGKVCHGNWRKAHVVLKQIRLETIDTSMFMNELKIWYKLRHPNIVLLFGACHLGQPFFVCEYAGGGRLDIFLRKHPHSALQSLYEAALGLQYLHMMRVVHGDLKCDNILVGSDGLAKLSDFGLSKLIPTLPTTNNQLDAEKKGTHVPKLGAVRWRAPEVLQGEKATFASDVYSFGMCILEAVSGKFPWALDDNAIPYHVVKLKSIPKRPAKCSNDAYELVKRMCCYNQTDRILISEVVRCLDLFARKNTPQQELPSKVTPMSGVLVAWDDLGSVPISSRKQNTIESILLQMNNVCRGSTAADLEARDLYNRLYDIFIRLKSRRDSPSETIVLQFGRNLLKIYSKIEHMRSRYLTQASRSVASRQEGDNIFTLHGKLDAFMEDAGLSRSMEMHNWQHLWTLRQEQRRNEILESFENLPALLGDVKNDRERAEAMEYIRYELATHPSDYYMLDTSADKGESPIMKNEIEESTLDVSGIIQQSAVVISNLVKWFIPAFELVFNKRDKISMGSFGTVYRGKWRHANVVVKKLKLSYGDYVYDCSLNSSLSFKGNSSYQRSRNELIEATFLNELEIWRGLHHPHVLQLFGACHIGELFFVCEYAGGGQLDKYLRTHPKQILQKLYEAALGLRYLHEKRVVHNDLKCDNILIGSDGLAKLTDFGLSTLLANPVLNKEEPETELEDSEKPNVGAVRWKAPEVLEGENATFASDVYSFGMCILEAVSGAYPWANVPDAAVKFHVVRRKCIPQCPENCSEDLYELVKRMCRYEASERIEMAEVVSALNELRSRKDNGFNLQTNLEVSKS